MSFNYRNTITCLLPFFLLFSSPALGVKRQMRLTRPPQIVRPFVPEAVNPADGDGKMLLVMWQKPPNVEIDGYIIERTEADRKAWIKVGEVSKDDTSFIDLNNPETGDWLDAGVEYRYRVVTLTGGWRAASLPSEGVIARVRLFNMQRANVAVVILIYFGSVLIFIRRVKRGKSQFVRQIAGMAAIDEALGRATEMGRPALYIPGIMDVDNIQTIASMVILTEVARKCAGYDVKLIVPLNRAFVVPLAEESVKQGYISSGRPDAYNPDDIRYLSDEQFAFTAGVTGIMNREQTAAHFFLGAFFAESLLVSEVGYSTGALQVAGTANIHQLPFFVVACDYTLIGEEFYAASAYVSRDPQLMGTLKGSDLVKLLIMIAVLVGSFLSWGGVDFVTRVLGV